MERKEMFEKFLTGMQGIEIEKDIPSLREVFKGSLNIGTSVPGYDLTKPNFETELIKKHFNTVVAENCCKMMNVYKGPGEYFWDEADMFFDFAKENNLRARWHNFVWHGQCAPWIFYKDASKVNMKDFFENKVLAEDLASSEQIDKRVKDWIQSVCDRYRGQIVSYDVVNEVISDKKFALRTREDHSYWQDVMGPDYVEKAFHWAHEADPNAELVINDYNLETISEKRQAEYDFVKNLLSKKVPVSAVGLQGHINMRSSNIDFIEETIEKYASLGVKVLVTELDVSFFDHEDKSPLILSEENLKKQADFYYELFECFKRQNKKGNLSDVILWGVSDYTTWKNHFPVPGRGDAPLLFGKDGKAKPAFWKIIENV